MRAVGWVAIGVIAAGACAFAFQREFRVYRSLEPYDNVPVPTDWDQPAEWVFGRLMYPSARFVRFERWGTDWLEGATSWTVDYPRADRHFNISLKRLTRVDVRSVEQPINPDDGDDLFNWPWLYVDLPGNWELTESQAKKIRDYVDRGGFIMADNFWGDTEWERFEHGMKQIFPDRELEVIDDDHQLYHSVFDLSERMQIPGEWAVRRGAMNRDGGVTPYWGAVLDEKGRVVVAISFNSDVGDSWEFADDPGYPEKYSALGLRLGANYVIYSLTH